MSTLGAIDAEAIPAGAERQQYISSLLSRQCHDEDTFNMYYVMDHQGSSVNVAQTQENRMNDSFILGNGSIAPYVSSLRFDFQY